MHVVLACPVNEWKLFLNLVRDSLGAKHLFVILFRPVIIYCVIFGKKMEP